MTRLIKIGSVEIGADRPIAIQSMTKTDTRDVSATIGQIAELREAGCDIVRVAVADMEAAAATGKIKAGGGLPLVADIHFDYRLALECVRQGVDKIRINPGNIGDRSRVKTVADAAKARGIPIRIGVNGGSLDKELYVKYGGVTAEALVESAVRQAEELGMCGFYDTVVSIKASDVFLTVEACRLFDKKNTGIPQHVGITETGIPTAGLVKSAIGIFELLRDGVGDTIRVSLTGDPVGEVAAAKTLLQTLGNYFNQYINNASGMAARYIGYTGGVELISCPTCGRCRVNMIGLVKEIDRRVSKIKTYKHIKAAVMGCAVNGPGEAREADVGVACGDGNAVLFKRGIKMYSIPENAIIDTLINEINTLL